MRAQTMIVCVFFWTRIPRQVEKFLAEQRRVTLQLLVLTQSQWQLQNFRRPGRRPKVTVFASSQSLLRGNLPVGRAAHHAGRQVEPGVQHGRIPGQPSESVERRTVTQSQWPAHKSNLNLNLMIVGVAAPPGPPRAAGPGPFQSRAVHSHRDGLEVRVSHDRLDHHDPARRAMITTSSCPGPSESVTVVTFTAEPESDSGSPI
jgi:hypothetical protein